MERTQLIHGEVGSGADSRPDIDLVWDALTGARDAEQLCRAWLPVVVEFVPAATRGLLLLKESDGSYVPAAIWPEDTDLTGLREIAEEALGSRQGVTRAEEPSSTVAYPLVSGNDMFGVAILELAGNRPDALLAARRILHWGAGWLMDLYSRRELHALGMKLDRSAYLMDLMLSGLAEADTGKVGMAIVNRLAQRFGCHQVMLGVEAGKTVAIEAISQAAWFEAKSNLLALAARAMDEAMDQRAVVAIPETAEGTAAVSDAHRRYAVESGSACLCSVPMISGPTVVGVLLLERKAPFSVEEVEALEALALALAPVIDLQRSRGEGLISHAKRSVQSALRTLTDASYPGVKLVAGLFAILVIVLALIDIDHRVGAPATVEGETQRSIVAPFEGFVQSAEVKAGDTVKAGQVMATLEDKDLLIEQARWDAEHEVAMRKSQEAMAKGDRVELRLASAQADQALAQLNLVREKLGRVRIVAPFDGVVVRGDLSQQIGSPVELGKVLFELSPLAAWRVIVKVDERDIGYVRQGMSGNLVVASMPSDSYPFVVSKVTSVATAEEGRNFFRVETALAADAPALRPNMEGVAKIVSDKRSVLWIWTHRLTDWMRLTLWRIMP